MTPTPAHADTANFDCTDDGASDALRLQAVYGFLNISRIACRQAPHK